MRQIGIAIAGLGNVGREAARIFMERRADFSRRLGADLRLRWVCDRDVQGEARRLRLPREVRRARTAAEALADPGVDVVVELFGGREHARAVVLGALAAGKHVVTANKLLLSTSWDPVWSASRRARRRVCFEAAVAGGIPIISALREGLAANRVSSVMGILNGTTNYILTRMAHEGCELSEALREAQRLGMAEKDPTLDLSGGDTTHKVSVLASLMTGTWVRPKSIPCQGIERVEAEDIRFAVGTLGRTVRLIGTVAVDWKAKPPRVEAHVQPQLVDLKHPLAAVHGGYNAVLVGASAAGDLMFYGKGAGPGPAASAVLGDVLMLCQDILAGQGEAAPEPAAAGRAPAIVPERDSRYYLKLRVRDVAGALSRITGTLGKLGISIATIHQQPSLWRGIACVMIVTHETSHARMHRAQELMRDRKEVLQGGTRLRFLP